LDTAVRVWDAATGKQVLICTLEQPQTGVYPQGVVWSADGRSLLAFFCEYLSIPGNDQFKDQIVGVVQIWDAETGHPVRSFHVLPPVTITGATAEAGKMNAYAQVRSWAMNERYLAVARTVPSSTASGRLGTVVEESFTSPTPTPQPTPTPPPVTATTQPTQAPTPTPGATPTPGLPPSPLPSTSPSEVIESWDLTTGSQVATLDPGRLSGDNPPTAPHLYVIMGLMWAPHGGNLAVNVLSRKTVCGSSGMGPLGS
jgi:hypothetical protein